MTAEPQPKISIIEKLILDARVNEQYLSFSQFEENEQLTLVGEFIFKVAAISGLGLSQSEDFCNELEQQIRKYFLKFGFSNLNELEMELALQLNLPKMFSLPSGITLVKIEPTGSLVNVDYIGKVFENYMAVRNMIDRKLKNFIDGIGYNY